MTTKKIKTATALLFATAFLTCTLAWSQARIDESRETATLYVDAIKGSDSNPGTSQLPLKTVGAAATKATSNNQAGVGTKVIIRPGTYREGVTMSGSGRDTTFPITFQAATAGTAIISGADVWTGWKVYNGNTKIYTHSWANKWGLCELDGGTGNPPPEQDIVRRREMAIVNGTLMSQVMSLSAMRVGTFYVNESNSTIYLWPPTGTDINTATVEIGIRPDLFTLDGKSNIVLRGLTFQYSNACRKDAAVTVKNTASNILVDNSFFNWNNTSSLKFIQTTYMTIQNSIFNHNGSRGAKVINTKYDLWQNNQFNFNGWRGAQGVYYHWGAAGIHFNGSHDQTLKDNTSAYNQTFGFHWDTDAQNVTADSLVAPQNQLAAGFVEQSEGPMTVSNSSFCNGNPSTGTNNVGFEVRNSTNVTLTGNTFLNNVDQLLVLGTAGGIKITNWETGQTYNLITNNLMLTNNIISGGSLVFSDGDLGGADWVKFSANFNSDYNTWWNTDTKAFIVPVPADWTLLDFAGWKLLTGDDVHSAFQKPSNPGIDCNNVQPDKADFWFIMDAFSGYKTVTRGQSVTFTPSIVPLKFTGTVTLASDGVQNIPGATASFNPGTIVTSGSSTFTVTTTPSTPKGSYNITLLATNASVTKTMTVNVKVQ
jgi:parallel beta helix pectate lyase-like protein